MEISFFDFLEFIANVKFVTEVFERKRNHVTFINIYVCVCTSRFLQVLAG